MSTLSEVLSNLKAEDKERLMLLFNNEKPGHVIYAPGLAIGVHTPVEGIKILHTFGFWYLGEITNDQVQ